MIEDPLSIKVHFQGTILKKTACWHVLLEKVSPDLVDCSCFGRFSTPKKMPWILHEQSNTWDVLKIPPKGRPGHRFESPKKIAWLCHREITTDKSCFVAAEIQCRSGCFAHQHHLYSNWKVDGEPSLHSGFIFAPFTSLYLLTYLLVSVPAIDDLTQKRYSNVRKPRPSTGTALGSAPMGTLPHDLLLSPFPLVQGGPKN